MTREEVNILLNKPAENITQADLDMVKESYDEAKLKYEIERERDFVKHFNNNQYAINETLSNAKCGKQNLAYNRYMGLKHLYELLKKVQTLNGKI